MAMQRASNSLSEPGIQLPLLAEAGALTVSPDIFCTFELPGEPIAWARSGATIRFAHGRPYVHFYLTAEQERYREALAWCAKAALRGKLPTSKPCAVVAHAFVPIPESWPWRKKLAARSGVILPTAKPDHDNYLKVVCDALKGIAWTDDAAAVDGRCIKRFSDKPAMRVEIREFIAPK